MSFYGKKHIGIFVLFILFLSTVFTGCNGEKKSEFYDNSGNSINGGIAVGNGKVTVYTDGKSLFEIENDTVNELYTIDGSIHGMLNVYDTYIYFYGGIEKNDGTLRKDEGYYSFNKETKEVKLILPYKPLSLSHYQDRIYFINPLDKNTIHSCSFDGKDMKKISNDSAVSLAMDENYIYYVSGLDLGLYKMKHDGSDNTSLGVGGVLSMMVYGDTIYFKDGYNDYRFTSVGKNGENKKVITDKNVFSYNVNQDIIYFSGDGDNGGLFRQKIGDNSSQSFSKDLAVHINVTDQYIFYRKMTDGRIYRSDIDGTDEVLIQ
ncbi:MAG: DUF5050 domain-containing protein [Clostridiaceae bacterium]|jgi:hypothetical protein|nr:DUF5050 domain-containing protein [Clostridiaceae bacterium]